MGWRWTLIPTVTVPEPGVFSQVVYDPVRDRIVAWGGTLNGDPLSFPDYTMTWEFYAGDWHAVTTAHSPARMDETATVSVFDHVNDVVLMNGFPSGGSVRETWAYDGSDWTQLTPATELAVTFGAPETIVWDSLRARAVIFSLLKTWAWDGTTWADLAPGSTQTSRAGSAGAYDTARDRIVMFGGYNGSPLGDTWEFDGSDWSSQSPPTSPAAQSDIWTAMSYNPSLARSVLARPGDTDPLELWMWSGTNWSYHPTPPGPGRSSPACLYHDSLDATVVYARDLADPDVHKLWKLEHTRSPQIIRRR